MADLNSTQASQLGDNFFAMAKLVGNYRMANRASLTNEQNDKLKEVYTKLSDYADQLFTTSAILVMNDVQNSLDKINQLTAQIKTTYTNLQKVQKAINIATAGVKLGAAIFSKDLLAIKTAVKGLGDSMK